MIIAAPKAEVRAVGGLVDRISAWTADVADPDERERRARTIDAALLDALPAAVSALVALAAGKAAHVQQKHRRAGDISKKIYLDNGRGRTVGRTVPAHPDKAPDDLVLVEEVRTFAPADRLACEVILDRLLGPAPRRPDAIGLFEAAFRSKWGQAPGESRPEKFSGEAGSNNAP